MSQLFASGGQSTGVSALALFLPMNTQDWSPLGWTGCISLQSKGLSSRGPGGILMLRTAAKSSRGASPHPSPATSWSPKHFISPFCFVSLWQANPGVWQLQCRVSRNSSVFFLAADTGSNVNEFSIPDCAFGRFPKHEEAAKRTQSLKMAGNSIPRGLKKCYSSENTMKPENNILMC